MTKDADILKIIDQGIAEEMLRFGVVPDFSWSGGVMDFEWGKIFTQNKDKLRVKILRELERQQKNIETIGHIELKRFISNIFDEGLSILTKSKKLFEGGGEEYHKWLER